MPICRHNESIVGSGIKERPSYARVNGKLFAFTINEMRWQKGTQDDAVFERLERMTAIMPLNHSRIFFSETYIAGVVVLALNSDKLNANGCLPVHLCLVDAGDNVGRVEPNRQVWDKFREFAQRIGNVYPLPTRRYSSLFLNTRHLIVAENEVLPESIIDTSDPDVAARCRDAIISSRREYYVRAYIYWRCEPAGKKGSIHELLGAIAQVHVFTRSSTGHEKRKRQTKYQPHIADILRQIKDPAAFEPIWWIVVSVRVGPRNSYSDPSYRKPDFRSNEASESKTWPP